MAYNHVFFAHKRPDETASEGYVFRHVYEHLSLTRNCSAGPCYKVRVIETKKSEDSVYWGWKDYEDKKYKFIGSSKKLVKMCSPDYFERAIKRKQGNIVNLTIEEICEIK